MTKTGINDIKAAIFDLDGTLLDSMWFWSRLDAVFLSSRGIDPIPEDYLLAIAHLGAYETAVYTKERFSLPESPEEMIAVWTQMSKDFYASEVKLKEGAKEYLDTLRSRGVKLGVATANSADIYMPALKLNGIDGYFEAFADVSEVVRKKGFPDIYLLAARRLGVSPEETAVFEDICLGVSGASAGGFLTVGVYDETSARDTELIKEKADIFIYGFEELL